MNTGKQLEIQKEDTQKSFSELQENTITNPGLENLGKRSGVIYASITNRIQEMEKRISGAEDTIENMKTTIKENVKCKKILTQYNQEIEDTMRRRNLMIIGIDEKEDFQLQGPANIFNKL